MYTVCEAKGSQSGIDHRPKVSRNPRSPARVTLTARVPSTRRIQLRSRQRLASAAPKVPPTCSRRSLQSRHGRQNTWPFRLAPESDPADGWFDVVVARDTDRELLLSHLSSGQNGQQHRPALGRQRGRSLSMQWTGSALHLDDRLEMSDGCDVEIAIRPGELRFLLPT